MRWRITFHFLREGLQSHTSMGGNTGREEEVKTITTYNTETLFFCEKSMWLAFWELSFRVIVHLLFSRVPENQFICQFLSLVLRKCWQCKFKSHNKMKLSTGFGIFMSLTSYMSWNRKRKSLSSSCATGWIIFLISLEYNPSWILNIWGFFRSNSLPETTPEFHFMFPFWVKFKSQGS